MIAQSFGIDGNELSGAKSLLEMVEFAMHRPCGVQKPTVDPSVVWLKLSKTTRWFDSWRNVGIGNKWRVILTGQIFSIVEAVENSRFYRSKAQKRNADILTFILTLRF
jgi:hypothetical protein